MKKSTIIAFVRKALFLGPLVLFTLSLKAEDHFVYFVGIGQPCCVWVDIHLQWRNGTGTISGQPCDIFYDDWTWLMGGPLSGCATSEKYGIHGDDCGNANVTFNVRDYLTGKVLASGVSIGANQTMGVGCDGIVPPGENNDGGGGCGNKGCLHCGMPVWSVSEPYLSLWLHDEPLGYQPTLGPRISLELAYKQREFNTGFDQHIFNVGKKWNFSLLSYVTQDYFGSNIVHFADGRHLTYSTTNDYLTNTRLTGDTNSGFTVSYPDGSKNVYGFEVTNISGAFQYAFLTEQWNAQSQKTTYNYSSYDPSVPVVRLQSLVDGDGRTSRVYYDPSNNFSTNFVSYVVDPFNRTNFFKYDGWGHLINIIDVAGISSSFTYDSNDCLTNMVTPYGTNSFSFSETPEGQLPPNGRSMLITQPDGGHQLYLYTNGAPGIASSYATNQIPTTSPFTNNFDNTGMDQRDCFYWGSRQYAALTSTTISSFTTNDFRKARMKHLLQSPGFLTGETVSMEREPSPDSDGTIEGEKTWYDHSGKTNSAFEGTQVFPLFLALVLPDGTTRFSRMERNGYGTVTGEISTYSVAAGGTPLLRTNIYVYDSTGINLFAQTNALGVLVSSNVYNAFNEVTTNYNALGEKTVSTYDSSNRVTGVMIPTGLVTTNIYGGDGFLAQQIVVGFSTNSYTYTNGLVLTQTDPRGLITTNIYDNLQRATNVMDLRGAIIYTYKNLDLVQIVDRMGFTNSYAYDNMRRKTNSTDALGRIATYNYCNCGSLDSVRDAAGNSTFFYYDNLGRLTGTVYPDLYSVTNTLNLIGQTIAMIDSAGTSATNWFNNQGLTVAVSNAFGRVQTTVHDLLDRATNSVDANGVSINTTYDNLNRVRTRSYPDGGVEGFGFMLNVYSLTSYTNQLNQTNFCTYDTASRKIAETNANGEITQFGYNGAGDLLLLTDGKNQTTSWNYDEFGRQTNKVDAAGNLLFVYKYDADNRLTNRWSIAKGGTTYKYDAAGNLTNIVYPISPAISMAYDVLNRLTNMVDAVGATVYGYNSVGQLLSEDGPWSNDNVSYTYNNRLRTGLSLTGPNATAWTQSYGYDSMKRLTNVNSPAGSFGYTYSVGLASGLAIRQTIPNGAYITNTYDNVARLLSTVLRSSTNGALNSHTYAYNLGNQRIALTNTAGDYRNYGYDNIGQLKVATGKESGGTTNRWQEQFGYAYDAAGNLTWRTNNTLLQAFNVNNLNELNTVNNGGKLTVAGTTTSLATNVTVNTSNAFIYADATFASTNQPWVNGNNIFTANVKDSYGRVDANAVTVNLLATNSYTYDLNGNLISDGKRGFDYDDDNELLRVTVTNQFKKEYMYDGLSRMRIRKEYSWISSAWIQTNEIHFLYDGKVIVQHRDTNNLPTLALIRGRDFGGTLQGVGGVGGLLALTEVPLNVNSYFHADGNGNVTCLINTNQMIVAKYEYDPFGSPLSINGSKAHVNLYCFSSQLYDFDTSFIHYLYRVYIPELNRWLNRDPIEEIGGRNLFAFIANNPVDSIDAWGLKRVLWLLIHNRESSYTLVGFGLPYENIKRIPDVVKWLIKRIEKAEAASDIIGEETGIDRVDKDVDDCAKLVDHILTFRYQGWELALDGKGLLSFLDLNLVIKWKLVEEFIWR